MTSQSQPEPKPKLSLVDAPPQSVPGRRIVCIADFILANREAILAAFDTTRARTRAWMDKTDGEYNSLWTLKRGGQQLFSVPRVAGFRSFVLHHIIHHRGQLSVYLRLTGVAVPAIYGPSADEGS